MSFGTIDSHLAETALGWKPTPLLDALKATVEFFEWAEKEFSDEIAFEDLPVGVREYYEKLKKSFIDK